MKKIFLTIIFFKVAFSLECGDFKFAAGTIADGLSADPGQFPYLFPLVFKSNNKKFCGANLIASSVALTGF